jgi:DNA N-6-adenine-methyltransferase (Dam)
VGAEVSDTDNYCTPKWLADRVGTFDLDPCSNARSHIQAKTAYMLPQDGLTLPWHGRVWMNHPYSDPLPWMRKLAYEHAAGRVTESLVLAKLDCSTAWWRELTAVSVDVWLFKSRIQFEAPEGIKTSTNNFCSVLVHRRCMLAPLNLRDVATKWVKL